MPTSRVTAMLAPPITEVCEIDVVTQPVRTASSETLPTVPDADPAVPIVQAGWFRDCDPFALASAICGLAALIPIVSQVLGMTLGVISLVRIRRARQRGFVCRGTGWAWAGILSSGLMLLVWGFIIAAMVVVGSAFAHVANTLPTGS